MKKVLFCVMFLVLVASAVAETQYLPGIAKNSFGSFEFSSQEGISEVDVTTEDRQKIGVIHLEVVDRTANPGIIPSPTIQGRVYKYLDLNPSDLLQESLETAVVRFRIPRSFFTDHDDSKSVALKTYMGSWTALPTDKVRETNSFIYYNAVTTNFGRFAVVVGHECEEDWKCSEWSSCSTDNTQTRLCFDANNCETQNNKPEEEQACQFKPFITANVIGYSDEDLDYWKGMLIVFLFIGGVVLTVWHHDRRKNTLRIWKK